MVDNEQDVLVKIGVHYGLSRTTSKILSFLFLSEEPQTYDQIIDNLYLSRSSVSIGMNKLIALGVAKRTFKNYYQTIHNPEQLITILTIKQKISFLSSVKYKGKNEKIINLLSLIKGA